MRDGGYRTAEEMESWKARDPISAHANRLVEAGQAKAAELEAIDSEIKATVDDAIEFARSSPFPDPATAADYIFSAGG